MPTAVRELCSLHGPEFSVGLASATSAAPRVVPADESRDDLSRLDSQTRLDRRSLIYPFSRARSFDRNLTGGQPAAMYEL